MLTQILTFVQFSPRSQDLLIIIHFQHQAHHNTNLWKLKDLDEGQISDYLL